MRALLIVVIVALAGCTTTPPADSTDDASPELDWRLPVVHMDPETRCAGKACLADSDSERSLMYQRDYNMTTLTDDKYVPGLVWVDGDWILWQAWHADSYDRNDVIAYHIPSDALIGLSMGPGNAVRPHLDDGRVIFQYQSMNYTGLAYWEAGSEYVVPLDTPKGSYWLHDFEGDWIAFSLGHAGNASGEYAWNIKTGHGFKYYYPNHELEERILGADLNSKSVFMAIKQESEDLLPWIVQGLQVNLTTQEIEEWPDPPAKRWGGIVASEQALAVATAEQDNLVYDIKSKQWNYVNSSNYGECSASGGKGGYSIWSCRKSWESPDDRIYLIYNLDSGDASWFKPSPPNRTFNTNKVETNGNTIAIIGSANTDFSLGVFLYPSDVLIPGEL